MALAARNLHALIGRVDNDNVPGGRAPEMTQPSSLPRVRPDDLELEYPTLSTRMEPETGILWAAMRHPERACFTPELMADTRHFQGWLEEEFAGLSRDEMPFRYLVWTSKAQSAWCMGGDLATFTRLIRARDERALRAYAYRAVDVIYDNYRACGLPIMTVALIQGDAVGGGFEGMLANDVVIAERGTRFGLPEILFNLFPGMGAHSLLKRRVGDRLARQLIEDGKTRTAEELYELGLIDVLCEKGEGEKAVREYVEAHKQRFATDLTLKRVRQRTDALSRGELIDIVDLWVDLALTLSEADLRRMDCLARHQERRRATVQ
jgi:DSF synthase